MTEARTGGTLSLPSYLIDEYNLISKNQHSLSLFPTCTLVMNTMQCLQCS